MPPSHASYAFIIGLVATIGIIVLAALHIPPPGVLDALAGAGVTGGAALALPQAGSTRGTTRN